MKNLFNIVLCLSVVGRDQAVKPQTAGADAAARLKELGAALRK